MTAFNFMTKIFLTSRETARDRDRNKEIYIKRENDREMGMIEGESSLLLVDSPNAHEGWVEPGDNRESETQSRSPLCISRT